MHIRKNRNRAVFIPFTKDIHSLLLNEDYTHIGNRGFIPCNKYLKTICKVINGYALNGLMFLSDSNEFGPDSLLENVHIPYKQGFIKAAAPELVKITDAGVLFPIISERTKEMYHNTNTPFYLFIDKTVEAYKALHKKIQTTLIGKQILKDRRRKRLKY